LTVRFRPAGPEDAAFLFALYQSAHEQEFGILPSSQREPILRLQFDLRHRGYTGRYPTLQYLLILLGDEPAGCLLVAEEEDELRVVDIAILTEYRNRGIGTYTLKASIQRAKESGKPIRLSVRRGNNAAARLYRRLGFLPFREDAVLVEMELLP
jgi:ribosomal protein S18 acetylase RimI-like enzyme